MALSSDRERRLAGLLDATARTDEARFADLGGSYHDNRTDKNRKARNHVRQLEALGYTVTITQAA
jgi:hypothetical protein